MHTRPFPPDGTPVSEVGLGTWQLGGAEWGDVSDAEARAVLEAAAEAGVTFFDTADIYGNGTAERRIGEFLRAHPSAELFVATKLIRWPEPGWPHTDDDPGNFSAAAFERHTRASIDRLGVDVLDLTQAHCPPDFLLEEGHIFDWLRGLQDRQLVKRWGVSVETVEEGLICVEQEGIDSLQVIFNVFRRKPIATLFERAKEHGVAIVVRLPLASGLLTGKFDRGTTFPETDHRNFNRDGAAFNAGETFAGLEFERGLAAANRVRGVLPADVPMAQAALRFCLDFDAVTTVIPGATEPEQARSNAAASDLPPLPAGVHSALEMIYREDVAGHIRGGY